MPIGVHIIGGPDHIFFTVQNQGPTISEDVLPNLFNSLVQSSENGSESRQRSSLGLGLYIAKQIATAHGGDIYAHSDDLNGTVFTAQIPR